MRELLRRWYLRLPTTVTRPARIFAWITLCAQIAIVGTGGAVRLTASGLGCDTWPRCVGDSLVPTAEMGVHGLIEFGNRLLTFVLVIIAVATFLLVMRTRATGRGLFSIALLIGLGIPAQAFIGGISVWTQLNPYVVGFHFVVSALMVMLSAILVWRVYYDRTVVSSRPSPALATLGVLIAVSTAVTVIVGILTTGSGPHAGDADAPRNGLDSELLQHLHSYPAYVTLALTVIAVVIGIRLKGQLLRWSLVLLAIEAVQIVVGITQSRLGLPVLLVGIHMVLACALVAAATGVVLSITSTPRSARDDLQVR